MKSSLLLPLLLALAACSSGSDGPRGGGSSEEPEREAAPALPECPDESYAACDVSDADCQAGLMSLAACLRESEPVEGLPIEFPTPEELLSLLEQDREGMEEPPAINHFERALSVLSLAPAEGVSQAEDLAGYVDSVDGIYRRNEKRILFIDRGDVLDDANANALLLHEMVHALQDADYDLANWAGYEATTFDAYLAARSVVEGEATFYQYRAAMPLLGLDHRSVDFREALNTQLSYRLGDAYSSPTPYGASYATFGYGFGAANVYETWTDNGPRGIDGLFASPPATTREIMARLYLGTVDAIDIVEVPEPQVTGLTLHSHDTLGAWGLDLFLVKAGLEWPDHYEHALGWRGDHLWVYTDEATLEQTHALWQIELASAAEAAAIDAVLSPLAKIEHGTQGTRVFVSLGFETPVADLTEWGQTWIAEAE
jgi:hypothetical protein